MKKEYQKIYCGLFLREGSVFCLDLVQLDIFNFDELKKPNIGRNGFSN